MKKWVVELNMVSNVTLEGIEADTEEEARKIAEEIADNDFSSSVYTLKADCAETDDFFESIDFVDEMKE